MMLGFLLARAGVEVVVLEKHADFLRDFRGDTVHPSTLELMYELGLLDEFLKLPHQKVETLTGQVGAEHLAMVDFRHLPTHCKYIALMPQWDFLNFLAEHGKRYPTFDLRMNAEATALIEEGGRVVGAARNHAGGPADIRADSSSGATVGIPRYAQAGLESDDYGAPMDVLWFRLPRKASDEPTRSGISRRADDGHARPRRLLAVRLCHSERRIEQVKAEGSPPSAGACSHVAVSRRPHRRIEKLGRRQAA